MIDDSPEKHVQNYGNLIQIAPFTGNLDDKVLIYLMSYLLTINDADNIRGIEKRFWKEELKSSN